MVNGTTGESDFKGLGSLGAQALYGNLIGSVSVNNIGTIIPSYYPAMTKGTSLPVQSVNLPFTHEDLNEVKPMPMTKLEKLKSALENI